MQLQSWRIKDTCQGWLFVSQGVQKMAHIAFHSVKFDHRKGIAQACHHMGHPGWAALPSNRARRQKVFLCLQLTLEHRFLPIRFGTGGLLPCTAEGLHRFYSFPLWQHRHSRYYFKDFVFLPHGGPPHIEKWLNKARRLLKKFRRESRWSVELLVVLHWKRRRICPAKQHHKTVVHELRFLHTRERYIKVAARAGSSLLRHDAAPRLAKDTFHRVECSAIPTGAL